MSIYLSFSRMKQIKTAALVQAPIVAMGFFQGSTRRRLRGFRLNPLGVFIIIYARPLHTLPIVEQVVAFTVSYVYPIFGLVSPLA
jgi:hypothetical protein